MQHRAVCMPSSLRIFKLTVINFTFYDSPTSKIANPSKREGEMQKNCAQNTGLLIETF